MPIRKIEYYFLKKIIFRKKNQSFNNSNFIYTFAETIPYQINSACLFSKKNGIEIAHLILIRKRKTLTKK